MMQIELNNIICGDCIDVMKTIPDHSIDMILCDLPYGVTRCNFDNIIPFQLLWEQYKRIIKKNSAIVLTASQPFTSALVMSNHEMFKYEWIWEKSKASNFLSAKKQPLKAHENILVFADGTPNYYPIMTTGTPFFGKGRSKKGSEWEGVGKVDNATFRNDNNGIRYPRTIQYFATAESEKIGALHPTQKPVKLFEYLIRTYTKENDTVLDNCAGSGTTGIACINSNRKYIMIEKEEKYCEIIAKRLDNHIIQGTLL